MLSPAALLAMPVLLLAFVAAALATAPEGPGASESPQAPTGFIFTSVEIEGVEVKGAIYRPRAAAPGDVLPIVVFLHGYGECGVDGSRQLTVGLPPALMADPGRWPFVVVMPQKPVFNAEWETYEAHVLAMVDEAAARHGGDPDRVAITGLSQGGHGTIAIASRHPDRFLCAAPVCGYVAPWNIEGARNPVAADEKGTALGAAADGLARMPVHLFHGERDTVVPPSESRALHEALTAREADVQLTIFPEDDHNSWDSTYRRSGVWRWFADHLASDAPAETP